ncbi:hypothetical protein ACFCX0_34485 [Streptomyces sp. NPDC056352]|uniref:hypothetical protein n=1 Tax=Streptomyces sp. NPDC056352 TaxID=3345791 RepID=UPI0035D84E3B
MSGKSGSLAQIARALSCRLAVIDAEASVDVPDSSGLGPCPDELCHLVVGDARRRGGRMPRVAHLEFEGSQVQVVKVPDAVPTLMIAFGHRDVPRTSCSCSV